MLITPSRLLEHIKSNNPPPILDVRSGREFNQGHVPGAVHRPFWAVLFGLGRIPFSVDERLVVYCQHGPRARMAGTALRLRGFRKVTYLEGHMARWRREHLREENGS